MDRGGNRGNGRGRGRGARPDNPGRSAYNAGGADGGHGGAASGNGNGRAFPIEQRMGRMSLPGERGRGGARGRGGRLPTKEEREKNRAEVIYFLCFFLF